MALAQDRAPGCPNHAIHPDVARCAGTLQTEGVATTRG